MTAPTESTLTHAFIFGLWAANYFIVIPLELNIVTTSSLIIYVASHRSLKLLHTDVPKADRAMVKSSDAYKMPIIASASLFGLYLVFKYVGKDVINLLISIYFSFGATFTLVELLAPVIGVLVSTSNAFVSTCRHIICIVLRIMFFTVVVFYFHTSTWIIRNYADIRRLAVFPHIGCLMRCKFQDKTLYAE
jgi:hypothetical protein